MTMCSNFCANFVVAPPKIRKVTCFCRERNFSFRYHIKPQYVTGYKIPSRTLNRVFGVRSVAAILRRGGCEADGVVSYDKSASSACTNKRHHPVAAIGWASLNVLALNIVKAILFDERFKIF